MGRVIQIPVNGFDNNFSYIVVGKNNKAILIDATGSREIIDSVIKENNLSVVAQFVTHSHPDHCENVDYYSSKGIPLKLVNSISKKKIVRIAGLKIQVLPAPGHTMDSVCFLIDNDLFTGDTLFVNGIGNTHYGGNDEELEKTLEFLSTLPSDLKVWPGHDYGGASSTLGEALKNSFKKPSKEKMKMINKKFSEYNSKKN